MFEPHLLQYDQTKFLWIGISLIIIGFFFTIWLNIYTVNGGLKGIPILAQFLIPTTLIGVGFSTVAYQFWRQYKETFRSFRNTKRSDM
jgi:hypothetical protein